jgi:hypothetical protein
MGVTGEWKKTSVFLLCILLLQSESRSAELLEKLQFLFQADWISS